jgi:hypothetical protein
MEIYRGGILSPWIAVQGNEMEGVSHPPIRVKRSSIADLLVREVEAEGG